MKSITLFLKIGILGIALGIILGAFGAHSFKDIFTEYEMDIWNKGIFYQITNFLGLLIIIILMRLEFIKYSKFLMVILILGILFFSGSLYTIALCNAYLDIDHVIKKIMIPITPLGGSMIIMAWILLFFKINNNKLNKV